MVEKTAEIGATRVRMNASQNANGTWKLEVTSEFPTVAEAAANLALAIIEGRKAIESVGGVIASPGGVVASSAK